MRLDGSRGQLESLGDVRDVLTSTVKPEHDLFLQNGEAGQEAIDEVSISRVAFRFSMKLLSLEPEGHRVLVALFLLVEIDPKCGLEEPIAERSFRIERALVFEDTGHGFLGEVFGFRGAQPPQEGQEARKLFEESMFEVSVDGFGFHVLWVVS